MISKPLEQNWVKTSNCPVIITSLTFELQIGWLCIGIFMTFGNYEYIIDMFTFIGHTFGLNFNQKHHLTCKPG